MKCLFLYSVPKTTDNEIENIIKQVDKINSISQSTCETTKHLTMTDDCETCSNMSYFKVCNSLINFVQPNDLENSNISALGNGMYVIFLFKTKNLLLKNSLLINLKLFRFVWIHY